MNSYSVEYLLLQRSNNKVDISLISSFYTIVRLHFGWPIKQRIRAMRYFFIIPSIFIYGRHSTRFINGMLCCLYNEMFIYQGLEDRLYRWSINKDQDNFFFALTNLYIFFIVHLWIFLITVLFSYSLAIELHENVSNVKFPYFYPVFHSTTNRDHWCLAWTFGPATTWVAILIIFLICSLLIWTILVFKVVIKRLHSFPNIRIRIKQRFL